MTTRKSPAKSTEQAELRYPCDNHPSRTAVLSTTGGGAHSQIHLCEDCARAAGRY
ncbi:hypothetical protein O1L60_30865 [Streptomyces diastatochromogenes]|nr:hypothetical protein [Streptomyces diastatochromogenes]